MGTDNGCGTPCDTCEPACAGKNGGPDGCGGTCSVCQPNCAGKQPGKGDGCGGVCPEIPVTCPAPPPGPQTVVMYATQATATKGWESVSKAEDKADSKFAQTPNLDKGENLTGTAFGVCDPDGNEIITSVKVGVRSKVQYDSGKYAIVIKLGALGKTKTFAHESTSWDEIDVTSAKASWTWNDVKSIKATVSLHSHPGGYRDSDVFVDAFRVTVGYTSCTPKVSKVCEGGNAKWVDGCGQTNELAEACDDGNACTTDGCAAGSCSHAVVPTPECINAPNPECTPKASKACFGSSVFWVDSCGIVTEVADSCDDGDSCTKDGCDATALACTHELLLTPGCGGCTPYASLGCLAASQVWKDSCGNVDEIAWYDANSSGMTHSVGQKKANAFGLFDMSGNVWEWVEDIYNEQGYGGLPTDGSANLSVGDLNLRVLRGGSWGDYAYLARSASRYGDKPSRRNYDIGFRVLARPK